jgi:sugar/nucleoside kinase (ribokinase family)
MAEERTGMRPVDVVGIGVNAADRVLLLSVFPRPGSKMEFCRAEEHLGGQAASAMIACRSWGSKIRYVGKVGSDRAAEAQSREFDRAEVETHLVRVKNCRSQNSVILVDQLT